jgi:hypothetical protein
VELLTGLNSKSRFHALPPNIQLGWKCLTMAKNLAYFDTESIPGVKRFTLQALPFPRTQSHFECSIICYQFFIAITF